MTESEATATRALEPGHLRPRLREKLPELLLEAAASGMNEGPAGSRTLRFSRSKISSPESNGSGATTRGSTGTRRTGGATTSTRAAARGTSNARAARAGCG